MLTTLTCALNASREHQMVYNYGEKIAGSIIEIGNQPPTTDPQSRQTQIFRFFYRLSGTAYIYLLYTCLAILNARIILNTNKKNNKLSEFQTEIIQYPLGIIRVH